MKRILFLGAHPDDVEIGCSGLIFNLKKNDKALYIVFTQCLIHKHNKNIVAEYEEAARQLGISHIMLDLPTQHLPSLGFKIRHMLESYREEWKPDTVFCTPPHDTHQDHRTLAEEAVRVFRNETILFYEPPISAPHFSPNYFQPLTRRDVERKLRLISLYKSQRNEAYMKRSQLLSNMVIRGRQCGCDYAEAFEVWRIMRC